MHSQIYCFPNGIRLVHQDSDLPLAHLGFIFTAGSRHENFKEHGVSHMVEHCLFKGTNHRKAYHVIARMENVGADINAFTSKEETVLHVSFLPQYLERSLDLLFDIGFCSVFPEPEIIKEKQVILDEIRSYREQAFDVIHEHFESLLFINHPLGRPILGTEKSVKSLNRKKILNFYKRNYLPENLIICSSGSVPFKKLIRLIEKYINKIDLNPPDFFEIITDQDMIPPFYSPFTLKKKTRFEQAHTVIGNRTYSLHDNGRFALGLLNNLLAGPSMSSMINFTLREKLGLAYHVEANYTPFENCGQWMLYFATDKMMVEKAMDHVLNVFKKLRSEKLGVIQMSRAKKQLIGQVFLLQDSNLQSILSAGKSLAVYGQVEEPEIVIKQIESVQSSYLCDVANELLSPATLSFIEYFPA